MPAHLNTSSFQPTTATWEQWRQTLSHWGITHHIAALLHAAGPLTVLGAQLLYLSEPFVAAGKTRTQWQTLAHILEDDEQQQLFIDYLLENDK